MTKEKIEVNQVWRNNHTGNPHIIQKIENTKVWLSNGLYVQHNSLLKNYTRV